MSPTEKIARFVYDFAEKDIPQKAWIQANHAIMDYVGVTLLGSSEDSVTILKQIIKIQGGHPQATIWGTEYKTSVTLAALANGTAAHSLDYDDTNVAIMSHPSIQLFPGLLALGEYEHRSGKDILIAYMTGFEVGAKLGRAMNPNLVFQGWFPVGILGMVMQTVACAKLLNLEPKKVKMAIGIATNLAAGLRCNNGTMSKHLMAGHVGSNGLLAALLSGGGITANEKAIEDRFGYFENFCRGNQSTLEEKVNYLGNPLDILQSGISFKLYPCCAGTHKPIDCALKFIRRNPLSPSDIKEIEISVNSAVKFLLIHPRPKTETEAKFSLEYCVSRAILDKQMGPEQFTPQKISDPDVVALMERTRPKFYDSSGEGLLPVEIRIRMKDGTVQSAVVEEAKGTPANPLSQAEIEDKFHKCCKAILPEARIIQAKEQLKEFRAVADVAEFVMMLRPLEAL